MPVQQDAPVFKVLCEILNVDDVIVDRSLVSNVQEVATVRQWFIEHYYVNTFGRVGFVAADLDFREEARIFFNGRQIRRGIVQRQFGLVDWFAWGN